MNTSHINEDDDLEVELNYRRNTLERIQSIIDESGIDCVDEIDFECLLQCEFENEYDCLPFQLFYSLLRASRHSSKIIAACSLVWERHIKDSVKNSMDDEEIFKMLSLLSIGFISASAGKGDSNKESDIYEDESGSFCIEGSDESIEAIIKFVGENIVPNVHMESQSRLAAWANEQARRIEAIERTPFKALKVTGIFKYRKDQTVTWNEKIMKVSSDIIALHDLRQVFEKLCFLHKSHGLVEANLDIIENESPEAAIRLSLERATSVSKVHEEINVHSKPIASKFNINIDRCISAYAEQLMSLSLLPNCEYEQLAIEFSSHITDVELRARTVLTIALNAQIPFSENIESCVRKTAKLLTSSTLGLNQQLQLMEIRRIVTHYSKDEKMQINLTDLQQGHAIVMHILGKVNGDTDHDDILLKHSLLIGQAYICMDKEQVLVTYITNLGLLLGSRCPIKRDTQIFQDSDSIHGDKHIANSIKKRLDFVSSLVSENEMEAIVNEVLEFCLSMSSSAHTLIKEQEDNELLDSEEDHGSDSDWIYEEMWAALTMGAILCEWNIASIKGQRNDNDLNAVMKTASFDIILRSFSASRNILVEFGIFLSPRDLNEILNSPTHQDMLSSMTEDYLNKELIASSTQCYRFADLVGLEKSRVSSMIALRILKQAQSEDDVSISHQLCVDSLETCKSENDGKEYHPYYLLFQEQQPGVAIQPFKSPVSTRNIQKASSLMMLLLKGGVDNVYLCDTVSDLLIRCADRCPVDELSSVLQQLKEMTLIKASLALCNESMQYFQGDSFSISFKRHSGQFVETPNILSQQKLLPLLGRFLLDTRTLHHLKDINYFANQNGSKISSVHLAQHEQSTEKLIQYLCDNNAGQLSLLTLGFIDVDFQSSDDRGRIINILKHLSENVLKSDVIDSPLALGYLLAFGNCDESFEVLKDMIYRVDDDYSRLATLASIGMDLGRAENQPVLLSECSQMRTNALWWQRLRLLDIAFDHRKFRKAKENSKELIALIPEILRRTDFDINLALEFSSHLKLLPESQVLCIYIKHLMLEHSGSRTGFVNIEDRIVNILPRIIKSDLKQLADQLLNKIDGRDYRKLIFMFKIIMPVAIDSSNSQASSTQNAIEKESYQKKQKLVEELKAKVCVLEILEVLCGLTQLDDYTTLSYSAADVLVPQQHATKLGRISFHDLWNSPWSVLDKELNEDSVSKWIILSHPLGLNPDEFYIRVLKQLTIEATKSSGLDDAASLTAARFQHRFLDLVDSIRNKKSALSLIEWICEQESISLPHKLQLKRFCLKLVTDVSYSRDGSNGAAEDKKRLENEIKQYETLVDMIPFGAFGTKIFKKFADRPEDIICQIYHRLSHLAASDSSTSQIVNSSWETEIQASMTKVSLLHEIATKIAQRYNIDLEKLHRNLVQNWVARGGDVSESQHQQSGNSKSAGDILREAQDALQIEEAKTEMRIVYVLLYHELMERKASFSHSNSSDHIHPQTLQSIKFLFNFTLTIKNPKITYKSRERAFRAAFHLASDTDIECIFKELVDTDTGGLLSPLKSVKVTAREYHRYCRYMGEIEELRMQQTMSQFVTGDKLGLVRGMLLHYRRIVDEDSARMGNNENVRMDSALSLSGKTGKKDQLGYNVSARSLRVLKLLASIAFETKEISRNLDLIQDIAVEIEKTNMMKKDIQKWMRMDLSFWERELKMRHASSEKYKPLSNILDAL